MTAEKITVLPVNWPPGRPLPTQEEAERAAREAKELIRRA